MGSPRSPISLHDPETLAAHLAALAGLDPRLSAAVERAGPVDLRIYDRGFAGMARVVCGQQLSVASARAIWARLQALEATSAERYLALGETALRGAGLSGSKHATLTALAEAERAGALDFPAIEAMEAEGAIATLTALKGIGPWTAEIYLLFCAGHPDVFPAGDLALQKAVAHIFELPERPATKTLVGIARDWSPHRGAAALMLWRYFSALRQRPDWAAL